MKSGRILKQGCGPGKLFLGIAGLLLWCAAGSMQALAATYIVNPKVADHGDEHQIGSLKWVLSRVGSAPATVVFPEDHPYTIGSHKSPPRYVVVPANVKLLFQSGAIITFGDTCSKKKDTCSILKIFGSVEAELSKIFEADPGRVRFQGNDPYASTDPKRQYRRAAIKEVYPQWWGAANCLDCDGVNNLRAFKAAFIAFPTRVFIPAGTYVLSDEWRLDFTEIPEIPDPTPPNDLALAFEVAGAGRNDSILIQAPESTATVFVGIYGIYPDYGWDGGRFHGLKILNPKGIGLKVENSRIHVSDLHFRGIAPGGTGIELEPNSAGCDFEHILMYGPGSFTGPFPPDAAFDPAASTITSGFKCPGRNVQDVTISRLAAVYFDIGINLFGRDGAIAGWKILNCDLSTNQIGINIRNSDNPAYNSIDIIGTYMEMPPNDHAYGIRLDPDNHPNAVRIEGGRIDGKGTNAREIEVHGYGHIIDVQYTGAVYGDQHPTTQIRSSGTSREAKHIKEIKINTIIYCERC